MKLTLPRIRFSLRVNILGEPLGRQFPSDAARPRFFRDGEVFDALLAARRNKRMVTQQEFEDAKDKVMMGAERRSMVMSEDEKKLTAWHEAGHALVALNVPESDPVHKATIIPRGRALGMVMQLPEGDKYSMNYTQMTSRLAVMMGGRVAEELIFGKEKVTSGAASDIAAATRLARMMVTRWGYSDELGYVAR